MTHPHDDTSTQGGVDSSLLEHALSLARDGVKVFPVAGIISYENALGCTCGKPVGTATGECDRPGKHPVTSHGHNDATTNEEQIRRWFTTDVVGPGRSPGRGWNLAMATGATSGHILVLDAESKDDGLETLESFETWTHGVSLPPTRRVRTGSGGLHLLYRYEVGPTITSRNRILPGLDIKADGGYVVTSPSRHFSGGKYITENPQHAIALAPGELVSWLITRRGSGSGNGSERPLDYDFADGGRRGQRDAFANDLAFRLRKSNVDWDRAVAAMRDAWEKMEQSADDVFSWDQMMNKLTRVWDSVMPDTQGQIPHGWHVLNRGRGGTTGQPPTDASPRPAGATTPAVGSTGDAGTSTGGELEVSIDGSGDDGVPPDTGGAAFVADRPRLGGEPLTDLGNSMRLARLLGDDVRYSPEEGRWYLWDGSRLKPDTLGEVMNAMKIIYDDLRAESTLINVQADRQRFATWADRSQSLGKRKAMLEGAGTEPGIVVGVDELDANPWQLVVRNGTLNLRTQEVIPSVAAHHNTRLADVAFDPGATCPRWVEHVNIVANGDTHLAQYLQRACGYTLTGLVDEQKFFFLWGDGENGKNVFIETIRDMLGDYGTTAAENLLTSDTEHSTIIAGLRGARLVMADETKKGAKLLDARLKMLTGSSKISARYMNKDFFEFDSTMKLWILGNNKPVISDGTKGMWRRMQLVPCNAVIPPESRVADYGSILATERPGILNWCLQGLADWLLLEGLGTPSAVTEAVAEYQAEEDIFGQFVDDLFEVGDETTDFVPNPTIMNAWMFWLVGQGIRDDRTTSTQLTKLFTKRLKLKAEQRRHNGSVVRGIVGLRHKDVIRH